MSDLQEIVQRLRHFARERNWEQFHSPKNLAIALNVEAGELLEVFQWLTEEQSRQLPHTALASAADELADVQIYLLQLADKLHIDIWAAVERKISKNADKYPADQVFGSALKPTQPDRSKP